MAAVYSAEEGSLRRTNVEGSSSENEGAAAGEQRAGSGGEQRSGDPEEAAVERGLPPGGSAPEAHEREDETITQIKIKEEQIEDNEYMTVCLNVAGEDSEAHATGSADLSGVDESAAGDWPFRCEDCSESFGNKEDFLEHRLEHTHDGPIVCLDADSQWDDLLVSTDGGRRTLCCALCGRIFSSSRGFFTHQLKHCSENNKQQLTSDTGQGLMSQKLFECKECGKMFSSIGQCLNHQRSHKQASKSVFHQLDHIKKKSFPCPTCGRCYSRASALESHRRCHDVKLVKSQSSEAVESPAQTEQETDAASEQMEASQRKRFECVCGRSFRTLCGLGTHQRFSTTCSDAKLKGEAKRSYHCSDCDKVFVSALALSCHQHWHKRRARVLGGGQTFKCKECGRVFTSLTFYNKHQRLVHSKEVPAKSFFNQVVHLQKKAFECQDCGLRFSRASALQSHQLCHTDIYNDIMEKSSQTPPAEQALGSHQGEEGNAENFAVRAVVYSQDSLQINALEKDPACDALDSIDHGAIDNGFEVISVTESDNSGSDSDSQGPNPDLELVCESDQEEKEDFSFSLSQEPEVISPEPINPEMNVKIVQINYDHFKGGLSPEMCTSPEGAKKYDCPDCDRTFTKAVALRCHMLWHRGGMGKKSRFRRNFGVTPIRRVKCEICGHESFSKAAHHFHMGKHEDRTPYKSITYQLATLQKNSFKCDICGMQFSRLSALHSHQQHHDTTKKPYACSQCDKSYANPSGLYSHRRVCSGKIDQESKDEQFNPTKKLLGPKVHHCKKCGKGFWSLGAFIHHKQYQQQCADTGMGSAEASHAAETGRVRRKRRGRKRGIVNRKPGGVDGESKEEHKCEVCGKSYRMLTCFLKHQLLHDASSTVPPVKSFDYQVEQLKKNSYSCPDCGKLFSRAMALQFHMKSHGYETGLPAELSDTSGAPQCQTCLAFFTCESALLVHQQHCIKPKSESEEQLEEKPKCEPEKQNVTQENANVQNQTGELKKDVLSEKVFKPLPMYKCDCCGRGFSFLGALNIHKKIHCKAPLFKPKSERPIASHEEPKAKFPFICSECGRTFSTNPALGTHKRWHKDKRRARLLSKNSKISMKSKGNENFSCNLCGKEFFYLCVLRRHQKYHPPLRARVESPGESADVNSASPKSELTCPDCKESFSSEAFLASHVTRHHPSLANIEEDAKKLQNEAPLSAEISSQTIKPISCSVPPFKTVPTKGDKLKLKYQCSHCQKSFLNIRGVRAHKWQKHRKLKGRPPGNAARDAKPLSCFRCQKRYSSHGALYNHENSCRADVVEQKPPLGAEVAEEQAHHSLEPAAKCLFKCHKCGKAFPSESQLDAHKEAARTRPHSCALCCRGYWTESQLQQHLAWHDEVRMRLPTELRYRLGTSTPGPSGATSVAPVKPSSAANPQTDKSNKQQEFSSPLALEQPQAPPKTQEPYRCSLCPQTFGEIRDLIEHHQECLGDKELRDTDLSGLMMDDESLTCIECGTTFDQETDLHQHYIEHARGVF